MRKLDSTILRFFAFAALVLLLGGVFLIQACGDDEGSCESTADCSSGQVCSDGTCVDPSGESGCRSVDDCEANEICQDRVCIADPDASAADAGDDVTDMGPDLVVDSAPDQTVPDAAPDVASEPDAFVGPPQVVSTDPDDGESGVALDGTISITFDRPMRATSFIAANLWITDYENALVGWDNIDYDEGTYTVTLAPGASADPLEPLSPYTVHVSQSIRDDWGVNLAAEYTFSFYTVGYPDMALYEQLATAYAPVVYAEVEPREAATDRTNRRGYFTRVDFDGDFDASNNFANARAAATTLPAHVYYSVLETETHYLIEYVFYYPLASQICSTVDTSLEHDFAFTTVLVQKLTDDPLGRFIMAEGTGAFENWVFMLDSYDNTGCGGAGEPPCPGVTSNRDSIAVEFSADELGVVDTVGRRLPVYLSERIHGSCIEPAWNPIGIAFPLDAECLRDGDPMTDSFRTANVGWSRVLTIGTGDNWNEEVDETPELTYTISPFIDVFWAMRDSELYDGSVTYNGPPGREAQTKHPSNLAQGADTPSACLGNNQRRPPFTVQGNGETACCGAGETCNCQGSQWFVDPAWMIDGENDGFVNFVTGHEYSSNYCFNPYLGIDDRALPRCVAAE